MTQPVRRPCAAFAVLLLGTSLALAGTLPTLESPELYDLQSAGFELTAPLEIELEAVGMWDAPGLFQWTWGGDDDQDRLQVYGWILDSETRAPVWMFDPQDADGVSGRSHLRRVEATLQLDPGRYEVYLFAGLGRLQSGAWTTSGEDRGFWERMFSDDSRERDEIEDDVRQCHVSLTPRGASGREVTTFEVDGGMPEALIRMNRAGDSTFESAGFRLERSMNLRVYSVYEHTRDDTYPADYAWIVDARTREVKWSPGSSRESKAGGGDKNRKAVDEISLEAGSYIVYFGSDDSHSLDEFNVNAPHDPYNWGITLLPGSGFDPASFSLESADGPEPAIAFREVGDRSFREQPFRVTSGDPVRILALGEYAGRDEFVDRAWIVDDATGDLAWTMSGANTRGAGGAAKNRMFDGLVRLPAGDYVLYYVSDGSHSAAGWNAAAPFRPGSWGVSLWPTAEGALVVLDAEDRATRTGVLADLTRVGDDEHRTARFQLQEAAAVQVRAIGEGGSGRLYDYGWIIDVDSGDTVWTMAYRDTRHAGGADKNRSFVGTVDLPAGAYEAHFVSDDSHSFEEWNAGAPRDPVSWGMSVRLAGS